MSKPEKKLFLLDAFALIYRAHFAFSKNPRINSKGMNTSAVFGFVNSLLEILKKEKPTHIGVAFDTSAPTFRHVQFPEYKAHREETPEDIRTATPIIKDILKAFNIPILQMDGFEADDVIGTLAKAAARKGFEVFMMTPDKDYAQLVEEHIYLYKPAYMGNGVDVLGVSEVLAKFEIENVDQVRDILGLEGDAADNIPGIPGVGKKTAIKFLQAYGTIEGLLENTADLKGKMKEKVEEFGQQGILSKELATIKLDVPIAFEEEDLVHCEPNEAKVRELFDELEFRTMLKRIFDTVEAPAPTATTKTVAKKPAAAPSQLGLFGDPQADSEAAIIVVEKKNAKSHKHEYHCVDTPELRKSLVKYLSLQEEYCFDTETTSINPEEAELVGIAFAYVAGEAYYVPFPADQKEAQAIAEEFRSVLENDSIRKVGQNLKYDIQVMKNYGIEVKGKMFDTMLAHYLIDPESRHKMDVLAENYLNYTAIPIEDLIGKGKAQKNMRDIAVTQVVAYAAEDADITLQLKHKLAAEIEEKGLGKLLHEVEEPLSIVLADVEYAGVKIDTDVLGVMSKELNDLSAIAQEKIFELAGQEFNINSPKQMGEVLFDKMQLIEKPKKTKTGQYATGEEILSKLAPEHEIAERILEFREYQKLKSTYVDALPLLISQKDGLIHTDYRQAVAATGRLSSNNPNLQNIPIRTAKGREIRKAFVPRGNDYTIFAADYSQIELRIIAAFAKDESMIQAFKDGQDIHATTASKVFDVPMAEMTTDIRRKAKEVNFGLIYGISAFGLSQNIGISRTEAAEIIDSYFTQFPNIKRYMDDQVNFAKEHEYVETLLGRRRYLRDINSRNATVRGFAERNAVNAPIQGSAADIIKVAMINIHDWMKKEKLKSKMIMQVHDELVFDAHKDELDLLKIKVEELMKNALPIDVPMEVGMGTGTNWLEAH
ncbi:DNA polymerase I [Reichenbachiella carrageenanivorans]|uniref:DNA polymerase I n=1 Tax=Reichenbachiella carrageenanivorans TaxID=2979869 RepID=A0ABY6D285_9BACT|nr:DNA polymerase I [Reichenbachiella carrageenanivorans]UXX80256.1 DNA polymerase I [Reichenbachiella carrageenanivorans]